MKQSAQTRPLLGRHEEKDSWSLRTLRPRRMGWWGRLGNRLFRRKHISEEELQTTDLARCLNTFDLTALGVGSTLGAGAYVIAGTVAKSSAGPAVIVSFAVAAIASVLAGMCYAEFGARVPKAGSAYVYTYVSVGELIAFVIGWNLILEYVIGAASVARTFSGYFDDLIGHQLLPFFTRELAMDVETLAPYFDPLALGITLLVTLILAVGVKESATFTNVFTALNLLVLTYIIICGAFKDDPGNWSVAASSVPSGPHCPSLSEVARLNVSSGCCGRADGCGAGGFAPYGFAGIMKGAATCFFAFVGFDAIATTGEEVREPQKAIPVAILASLAVVFLFYSGISVTLTMMSAYFLIPSEAPFAAIFQRAGWTASKYVVSVGAICALCTSLLGAMFPMPRVVLAMGRDGLVFRFFAAVNARLKTPVRATLVTGSLAALMAALFDIESLVNMMSIGTLLAYTLVSACVLILRYDPSGVGDPRVHSSLHSPKLRHPYRKLQQEKYDSSSGRVGLGGERWSLDSLLHPRRLSPDATPLSSLNVRVLTCVFALLLVLLCSLLTLWADALAAGGLHVSVPATQAAIVVVALLSVGVLVVIWRQPQSCEELPFTVPLVPWFPALSMFFNIYLMMNLDWLTWVRFAGWMAIGFVIYFGYGMWHSSEETNPSSKFSTSTTKLDEED